MGLSGFLDSWLTRDTIFGVPIDDVFSFRTTKIVRVQDRTLGAALPPPSRQPSLSPKHGKFRARPKPAVPSRLISAGGMCETTFADQ